MTCRRVDDTVVTVDPQLCSPALLQRIKVSSAYFTLCIYPYIYANRLGYRHSGMVAVGAVFITNNNNNNRDDIYGAVIMAKPLRFI